MVMTTGHFCDNHLSTWHVSLTRMTCHSSRVTWHVPLKRMTCHRSHVFFSKSLLVCEFWRHLTPHNWEAVRNVVPSNLFATSTVDIPVENLCWRHPHWQQGTTSHTFPSAVSTERTRTCYVKSVQSLSIWITSVHKNSIGPTEIETLFPARCFIYSCPWEKPELYINRLKETEIVGPQC